MSKVRQGTVFTAEIDRVSGSGNGIIELNDRVINIGPIPQKAVGEQMKAVIKEIQGPTLFALCVSEKYISVRYLSWAVERFDSVSGNKNEKSGEIISEVERITNNGNPLVYDPRYPQAILVYGSTEKVESGDIVEIRLRSSSHKHSGKYRADLVKIVDDEREIDEWLEEVKKRLNINDIQHRNIDVQIGAKECTGENEESIDNTQPSSQKLESLREQAKKESVESVSESAVTRTQTTQQYRRSQKVRDYVMARADGVCEGCREPAPFTSKTGEPYLHAHHIYELSEGGSDTPETVIALCPNCHYRVHHSIDGDEYNQELLEKVRSIESA